VILSLANLNKVEYDASKGVITLGPGQPWGNVYEALKDTDVTALGGRIPFVGVGGFTVGGGMSYLQNHYGLASDSIVDAQVVLADGSIKWAKDDPELLFAVKGAGYTIGVITELVVKAYPKPKEVYAGFVVYPIDHLETIKQHVADFSKTNTDPNLSLLMAVIPFGGGPVVLINPIVFGSESFAKSALPWVWSPGSVMDTTASLTWEGLQDMQLAFVKHPAADTNYQQHSVMIEHMTADFIQTAISWQLSILSDPRWAGVQMLFEPFVPKCFSAHTSSESAWPHSNEHVAVVQVFIEQPNAKKGDEVENAKKLREGSDLMESVKGIGKVLPRYPNYYLQGTPAVEFYENNLPKLKAIKQKLDPKNRFNKGVSIV
jgi:FAD/FMN-containing dehydrogenase